MRVFFVALIAAVLVQSCSNPDDPQVIVDRAIKTHGFDKLPQVKLSFDFRDKTYSMQNVDGQRIYTRTFEDDSLGMIKDKLVGGSKFTRMINDEIIALDKEWTGRYSRSVNSVLYFAQLPLSLNDPAVNKKYLGKNYVKDEPYQKVQITFNQEGGGEDHDDVFVYWFHESKGTLDYLAYSYAVDGGGVRFREAINRRNIDGFTFQDYVNYEAEIGSDLSNLDELFESGRLKELSRIENENFVIN